MEQQPPLNWQASADSSNPIVSSNLPEEVVQCLGRARFLHLATCDASLQPHISLMSYTYLPPTAASRYARPAVIMTTNPSSRKTAHVLSNPSVSVLAHDWVSPREGENSASEPPAAGAGAGAGGGGQQAAAAAGSLPFARRPSGGLASLLFGLNAAALGRISVTMQGRARILDEGSEEEKWCRRRHLASHGFGGGSAIQEEEEETGGDNGAGGGGVNGDAAAGGGQQQGKKGDGFLEGEDVRVMVVELVEGRIADWEGKVKDFVVQEAR